MTRNFRDVPGDETVPDLLYGAGSGSVRVIAQSAVAVPLTGSTSETTLATITVPGGAMGANGRIRVTMVFTMTNSANAKTMRMRINNAASGTAYQNIAVTTQSIYRTQAEFANRNSASSQAGGPTGATGGFGGTANALNTSTINTANDFNLYITGQLANSAETLQLESYVVELLS